MILKNESSAWPGGLAAPEEEGTICPLLARGLAPSFPAASASLLHSPWETGARLECTKEGLGLRHLLSLSNLAAFPQQRWEEPTRERAAGGGSPAAGEGAEPPFQTRCSLCFFVLITQKRHLCADLLPCPFVFHSVTAYVGSRLWSEQICRWLDQGCTLSRPWKLYKNTATAKRALRGPEPGAAPGAPAWITPPASNSCFMRHPLSVDEVRLHCVLKYPEMIFFQSFPLKKSLPC